MLQTSIQKPDILEPLEHQTCLVFRWLLQSNIPEYRTVQILVFFSRLQYEETELFILRVMVAIIILYDHVHPNGAFAKGIGQTSGTEATQHLKELTDSLKILNDYASGLSEFQFLIFFRI